MTVLPDNINPIDGLSNEQAIGVIYTYIQYMREHVEFANSNLNKLVNVNGISVPQLIDLLNQIEGELAALGSTVNALQGTVNGHTKDISDLKTTVGEHTKQLEDHETRIKALEAKP